MSALTELRMERKYRNRESVISRLYFDDAFECFILEGQKTMIPAGRYEVRLTYSQRFDRTLPILVEVPGRRGIRIHPGNKAVDTLGCLLPGTEMGVDVVFHSVKAFDALYAKLEKSPGPRFITITEE